MIGALPRLPHVGSGRPTRCCSCAATATSSWHGSVQIRYCCPVSPSRPRRYRSLSPSRRERGSASIVAAFMMALLLAVTVGAVHVGAAVIARHRAQAAADLSALAAAGMMPVGLAATCEKAAVVAAAMGTAVTACTADALDVAVTVDAPVPLSRWGVGSARAVARAGPADSL